MSHACTFDSAADDSLKRKNKLEGNAPPIGRAVNRRQTDDVVRSVDQSSSMADQSRQIKLAAAKKKVKKNNKPVQSFIVLQNNGSYSYFVGIFCLC